MPDDIAQKPLTSNSRLATAYVDKVALPFRGVLPAPSRADYQWFPPPVAGETFAEYAERLYNMGAFQGSKIFEWDSSNTVDLCQGIVLNNSASIYQQAASSIQAAYSSAIQHGDYAIQSVCAETPPAARYCINETDSLDFNFGILVASHAQNMSLSRDITLNCTESVKVGLLEPRQGSVTLSNGGTLLLTSNNKALDGSQTVIAQGGANRIPIKATLSELGKAGEFSGSTVITITYP